MLAYSICFAIMWLCLWDCYNSYYFLLIISIPTSEWTSLLERFLPRQIAITRAKKEWELDILSRYRSMVITYILKYHVHLPVQFCPTYGKMYSCNLFSCFSFFWLDGLHSHFATFRNIISKKWKKNYYVNLNGMMSFIF